MAQSIKLGSDTYLDASGVEMNSSNTTTRRTLQEWGAECYGFSSIFKGDGESATLTLPASGRAIVFTDGVAGSLKNIYIVAASTARVISYRPVFEVSSQVPITTANGTITFTNNSQAGGFFCAFTFSGDSSWS